MLNNSAEILAVIEFILCLLARVQDYTVFMKGNATIFF